jgi:acetylornithine/succinyldiaminopimelate/putrescine aminotransferase
MQPLIASARGATLVGRNGREYLDLSMGYGSVWLGHADPAVMRALTGQLGHYAAPGYLSSGAFELAAEAIAPFLPDGYYLGGIYSTGMEAVEAALRAAWAHTGRQDIAGFAGSEHGRSYVAAALGAAPAKGDAPFVHRLPGFADTATATWALERLAETTPLAAVVVEPIQMTGGGHAIGGALCERLFALAREKGFAVIFDEALTAPYRCGARLYSDVVGQAPDVIVLGKGLGNGFPCAAVALRRGFTWGRAVRPSSTYWNHPLACAAVSATLGELARLRPIEKVREIEAVVRSALDGVALRGAGAMWCLAVPDASALAARLLDAGVVVSYYPGYIRLLPPLCIETGELRRSCEAIKAAHAHTLR